MEGHICQGGKYPGMVRKYPSIVCSMCMGRYAVEVDMDEERIDDYNKKWLTAAGKLNERYEKET